MTTKDLIIQELDQLPESVLEEALEAVRSLKAKYSSQSAEPQVWEAYLKSKQKRDALYRRLADS
jgi:hypothetical protein